MKDAGTSIVRGRERAYCYSQFLRAVRIMHVVQPWPDWRAFAQVRLGIWELEF